MTEQSSPLEVIQGGASSLRGYDVLLRPALGEGSYPRWRRLCRQLWKLEPKQAAEVPAHVPALEAASEPKLEPKQTTQVPARAPGPEHAAEPEAAEVEAEREPEPKPEPEPEPKPEPVGPDSWCNSTAGDSSFYDETPNLPVIALCGSAAPRPSDKNKTRS